MIRAALAAAVLLGASACAAPGPPVLLVRHAEKGPGRDPDLTGDGKRRAMALIEKARAAGVTAGYHTQYRRTAQTLEPLATHLGLPLVQIEYIPGKEDDFADAVVKSMEKKFPGQAVIVASHTTTIPALMKRLGVPSPREVPETEYGTLFVVYNGTVTEDSFSASN